MRKVLYYYGGTVADFAIPDDRFAAFAKGVPWEKRHSDDDLHKARRVLEAFMRRSTERSGLAAGANETLAACFIWNYFNTHPDDTKHIQGDVVVIDLHGDGTSVDYAAVADVQIARES
jgi:hypothetical protein